MLECIRNAEISYYDTLNITMIQPDGLYSTADSDVSSPVVLEHQAGRLLSGAKHFVDSRQVVLSTEL